MWGRSAGGARNVQQTADVADQLPKPIVAGDATDQGSVGGAPSCMSGAYDVVVSPTVIVRTSGYAAAAAASAGAS